MLSFNIDTNVVDFRNLDEVKGCLLETMRMVKETLRQQINMRNWIKEAVLAKNVSDTFGNSQSVAFENVLESIQNLRKEIMQLEGTTSPV
ncbi:hypothetical protein B9Z55_021536 [Caenorhabditis nigoni]|uniref:Uncharacterized protein n=1 Tax=Caenorhabditis nigoni TaxID=1611254 RepID=A0A2G5TSE8_9PELO|nr:hypothetical protein B9Z55_021536 [Caenorhabditis nigoni]